MVPGDQNGIRPQLHLVLQDDSSPAVQPAACGDEDIFADFHAIAKVDGHAPGNLKISLATFERRPQQKPAQAQDWLQIGQPVSGRRDEMEPEVFEDSHFLASYSCGTAALSAGTFAFSSLITELMNRSSVWLRAA